MNPVTVRDGLALIYLHKRAYLWRRTARDALDMAMTRLRVNTRILSQTRKATRHLYKELPIYQQDAFDLIEDWRLKMLRAEVRGPSYYDDSSSDSSSEYTDTDSSSTSSDE